ncbi:MAG TPA: DUF1385 domain-containing protein [Lachnospiraceae bacterium]
MKSSNIGGQAVMEGIMMRHKEKYAIAVRKPDKEIEVKVEDYKSVLPFEKVGKLPILRGVYSFIDSLVIGMKCLMYSASFFEEEEEGGKDKEKENSSWWMTATVAVSILFSIGLFILLPYLLASLLRKIGFSEYAITAVEAVFRILIFLTYMYFITFMKDIQRVFMYHGAEHKCINCIESGKELTVENVLSSTRFHKRCGTSFLFLVMVVSIIVFIGFFAIVPIHSLWLRVLLRVLLMPLVAGISYEFIRLAGNSDKKCVVVLSKPGLALQKLTTREPDADMVEVAILAVEAVFDWREYLKESNQ